MRPLRACGRFATLVRTSPRTIAALRASSALSGLAVLPALAYTAAGHPAAHAWTAATLNAGPIALAALALALRALLDPRERLAWALLAAGAACYAAGPPTYYALGLATHPQPFPSPADVAWLAFYPLSYAGLGLLLRARLHRLEPSLWLDGLVVGLSTAAVGGALALEPILSRTGGTIYEVAVNSIWIVLDLTVAASIAGVASLYGWRPDRSWLALLSCFGLLAVADALYLSLDTAAGPFLPGAVMRDTLYPAAFALLSFAAVRRAPAAGLVPLGGWRLRTVPVAFGLTAMGVLVFASIHGMSALVVALATAAAVAAMTRASVGFRQMQRLLESQREAATDALTGLSNRRKLLEDLATAVADPARPRLLALFDLDGFKGYNDTCGHLAGDALLTRLAHSLRAAVAAHGDAYRLGGDEFCILVDAAQARDMAAAAATALSERGPGYAIGASHGAVLVPDEAAAPTDALRLADARMYAAKDRRESSAKRQMCQLLVQVMREAQPDVEDHSSEVALLAVAVGRGLGLDTAELNDVARAAELHDIGKVAIPSRILAKPGPLDEEEWNLVRTHTLVGERIVAAAAALRSVARLVRASHERYDGRGYPDGLAGEQIPLAARIVAVCDAFAAMVSDRSYRPALSPAVAIAELRACAGTQFDRTVVEALVAHLGEAAADAAA
jgi:two-component system, cell cycle response regulator